MPNVIQAIEQELKLVELKINNELLIKKSGHAGKFAHLEFTRIDDIIRPAITIFSAKLFNFQRDKIIALASIMQLAYMAFEVHAYITEQDELSENGDIRDGCQFPVLVGDFLYGKGFMLAVDAGILNCLEPMAKIVCSISEGKVLKIQHPQVSLATSPELVYKIVCRETAELFAGAAKMSAEICGASELEMQMMHDFGLNFGVGFGLWEKGVSYEYIEPFFNKAIATLQCVKARTSIPDLINLIHMFRNKEFEGRKMVV